MSLRAIATILLLFLAVPSARGQERLLAGPTLGYEFSVPLLLQRSEGAINYEPGFEGTGTSWSHTVIAGGQIIAPREMGILGYSARLALFATSGSFVFDPFVPGIDADTVAPADLPPERYRHVEVDFTAASLVADAQLRASLGEHVVAGLGLWTSYRISGQFTRTERPEVIPPGVDPEDATIVIGGDRIASYELGYGGVATLGALVGAGERIVLMPELQSRVDAVALRRGLGIKALTIGAGLSVLFDPSPSATLAAVVPPPGSDSLAVATSTRPLRLEARVDLFADAGGSRAQSALVEPEEVVNRIVIALPRVIEYEPSAYDVPGGFARIAREQTSAFSSRSLAGLDLAGHWRHYLNVLGLRLREAGGTKLAITGISAPGEPAGLARVRAEVLRDYLVSTWGIESSRLTILSRQGPAARVTLDGPEELFQTPLVSQWRSRRYRMPQLGLDRFIVADAGVRRWRLELTQGARVLAQHASDSGAGEPELDVRFIAGGDSSAPIAPIVATLTVEDSLGRTTVATDELRLSRLARTSSTIDRGERLELVTFDHALDSASSAGERRLAARRAARMLRDGAVVSVGIIGAINDNVRRTRALDVARIAEELLAAANERGVRIGRFVAEREGGGEATPSGIRIVIEQPHGASSDTSSTEQ